MPQRWADAQQKIDAFFEGRERPRYHGDLPAGNDGLGLGLLGVTGEQLPSGFNLLFFGHFSELSRERYLSEMARALTPDGSPYHTWSNDIYSVGTYLRRYKYRYLRYSYLLFLAGFVLSCVLQGWHLLTH